MDENKTNQEIESFRKNLIEVESFREKYKDAKKPPKPEVFAQELAETYRGWWYYSSKKRTWMVYEFKGSKPTKQFEPASKDAISHAVFVELDSRGLRLHRTNSFMNRTIRCLKKLLYDENN